IWTQERLPFDPGFLSRNQQFYAASVQGVNFEDPATAILINRWASDHTLGYINRIVTPDDIKEDCIELTNAVYFKGPWSDPFDPTETMNGEFTKADGSSTNLPMMRKEDTLEYQQNNVFQAVR